MRRIDGLKKVKEPEEKPRKDPSSYWEDFNLAPHPPKENHYYTKILGYIFLFLIVGLGTVFGINSTLSYKQELETQTKDIEKEIQSGLDALNNNQLQTAIGRFTSADKKLKNLKINLQETGQYIPYFFYLPQSDSKFTEASRILKATSAVTNAVSIAGQSLSEITKSDSSLKNQNQVDLISTQTTKLLNLSINDKKKLAQSLASLKESEELLLNTKSSNFQKLRQELLKKIPVIEENLNGTDRVYSLLPQILASNGQQKYLILFQNNSELRPAGGFLGSYAVANFADGKLKSLDFQTNIYKLDKPYLATHPNNGSEAPEYSFINAGMAMKDSNYNYDFVNAMKRVLYYYNQETGDKAAGVIALDTTLITNLLKIVGPIQMPDYGLTVTDQNFLTEIEYQVEIGYFKDKTNWPENAPKKILEEMMPKIIGQTFSGLTDSKSRDQIMKLLDSSMTGKHLLFYSENAEVEKYLEAKNLAGRVADTSGDYFFLSNSNIGGLKSSLNVQETITQNLDFDENGGLTKTVTVQRHHAGSYTWPDGINKTYNKMIVPKGSKVLEWRVISGDDFPLSDFKNKNLGGVKTSEENGKTIFGFWLNTKPGEDSKVQIKYRLPASLNFADSYSLLMQKQPGTQGTNEIINITNPRKQVFLKGKKVSQPVTFNLLEDTSLSLEFK